jgi:hypothetical protein
MAASDRPTYEFVAVAVDSLTGTGRVLFRLSAVIRRVQLMDPSRDYESIEETIRGMTFNAAKRATSPLDKPLILVAQGWYRKRQPEKKVAYWRVDGLKGETDGGSGV